MSNREKPKLVHIVIEAAIPVIIGLMFSVAVQWFTMESAIVNISASAELDGQYLTVVSVQNLKEETLPGLSLYIDSEIDILDMKSSDGFNLHQHYIESDSISPKSNYTLTIWTEQPILQGQIIAESDYKISMNSAERNTPFIVQILWAICVAGIVMIIGSSITLWFSKRRILQVQNNIREVEKKSEKASAELEKLSGKMDDQKEQSTKAINELRLYYFARISDLQKELSFWRDTVRKMLYNSQYEFQTADRIIETVTSTLKTYTTRKSGDENMDELLYLAELIADSRELHSKYDSADSKNHT
ncbi:hypothetical protein [Megasphaera sp. An286]|uniref:hypothetical protein n=1 Tax=Megasphaera sp. An286 TaxID=1965622 RepID=UPI000B3BCB66|nr:hypothetical protein [Megasphaera sp. An286]OUO45082.1 hypothetical protein B5F80_09610 [Megasphaera sp. An286]